MPATENPTLSLIQREINDAAQREKEYQLMRTQPIENNNNNTSNNNNHNEAKNGFVQNGNKQPPAAVNANNAESVLINGTPVIIRPRDNRTRKFVPHPGPRGIMQQFIKSKGKLSFASVVEKVAKPTTNHRWSIPDIIPDSPTRIVNNGEPVKRIRKGFVPVEERMQKEFKDLRCREMELQNFRKSIGEFSSLDEYETPSKEPPKTNLRPVRSMTHLYNLDDEENNSPLPSPRTLKPAVSLAELCDVGEDELNTPSTLIRRWEYLIKENQERN